MSERKICSYTWYGEATVDCDNWEEPVSICILICNGCGWTFYGDCFSLNEPGFDYKGEQIPNYCPHCGRELV